MTYEYKLSKSKVLSYSTRGKFACPTVAELELQSYKDGKQWFDFDRTEHNQSVWTGDKNVYYLPAEKKELENGDIEVTSKRVIQKVLKGRKDLKCKCGQNMIFMGYAIWIDKIINAGTIKDFGLGRMRMNRETRQLSHRYFAKKSSQTAYINKQITKARG